MITAIHIENFKGIADRVTIPLKPITLLFGPNSAGKSTILHAIHYGREIIERRNLDADKTIAGGDFVDLGGFRNFVHGHDLSRTVTLGFELSIRPETNYIPRVGQWQAYEGVTGEVDGCVNQCTKAYIELGVMWSAWQERPIVSKYTVSLDGNLVANIVADPDVIGARLTAFNSKHPFIAGADESEPSPEADVLIALWQSGGEEVVGDPRTATLGLSNQMDALPFMNDGLETVSTRDPSYDGTQWLAAENLLSRMMIGPLHLLLSELKAVRYVGPLRQTPSRNHESPRHWDPTRWSNGLAAWDFLKTRSAVFVQNVSDWLSSADKFAAGYSLRQRRYRELDMDSPLMVRLNAGTAFDEIDSLTEEIKQLPEKTRLWLVDDRTGIQVDPEDVGEGIAQVVPVIAAALAPVGSIIAIEQPELHIHPRLQTVIGDLLIYRTSGASKTDETGEGAIFLIETHSEHLLLRLLRRIRESMALLDPENRGNRPAEPIEFPLTPDRLAVIYVQPADVGVRTKELRVNAEGEFIDPWPQGFFGERGEELFS